MQVVHDSNALIADFETVQFVAHYFQRANIIHLFATYTVDEFDIAFDLKHSMLNYNKKLFKVLEGR